VSGAREVARATVLCALLAACAPADPARAPLALERVEPASGLAGTATAIRIVGSGFRPRISADFGEGGVSADPRFRAALGGVPLRSVVYVGADRLDAEVPPELPAGHHALEVVDPDGRRAVLEDAFLQRASGGPCGDGIVDAAAGEACDPGDPGGAGCCDPATCRFAPAGAPDPEGRCAPAGECATAACDGAGGCVRADLPDGTACTNDGLYCTGPESCQAGACTSPGDPCPAPATCNEAVDRCVVCGDGAVDLAGGESCDPGDGAGDGCCDPATCRFVAPGAADPQERCAAPDGCSTAACDGAGGCALTPRADGLPCGDDGLFCTGAEACLAGRCAPAGDPCAAPFTCSEAAQACVRCGDGVVQAAAGEQCDPGGGADPCCDAATCRFAAAGAACEDGRFCTAGDACDGAGACVGGASPCPRETVAEASFDALAPGEPLGADAEWTIADARFAAVAPGCGSAAALGPSDGALVDGAASLLATWTTRAFSFVDPALAAVRVEAAFETDPAGHLAADRVGFSVGGSPSLFDFMGVTADTLHAGGAGLFLSWSSGALRRSARLASLPALAPSSWYRLRAVFTRSGPASLRVDASLAPLDASCAEAGPGVAAPPIDTGTLADPPRPAYLAAPVLAAALANGGAAAGAVDRLRLGLDHGGAATPCAGCDEGARRCAAPAGAPCASDGAFCTGAERCDGLGFCTGEGDPCSRAPGCGACDEAADACAPAAPACAP
jgi:hypothetical protein